MKHTIKKTILYFAIFAFALFGAPVLAEETLSSEEEKSLEALMEVIEIVAGVIEEMKEKEEKKADCELYLTEYIGYGKDNNPEEVEKLQTFLNKEEGENLPVTGFYGEMTLGAVNRLQVKYAEDILEPWGITEPTGYVYKTTTTFINNRNCPGVALEVPELIPDATYTTAEITQERTTQKTIEGTREEGDEDNEDWIEENWEELRAAEEEEEDEDNGDSFAWALIIIGSIGLGVVLYNIYTFKPKNQ